MKLGTNQLASLILEYLAEQDEPYQIYGQKNDCLSEEYRNVVNTGLYSYQIYHYLLLIERVAGTDKRWLVRVAIQDMLKKNEGGDVELGNALNLISSAISIGGDVRLVEDESQFTSQELNIAMSFLLGLRNSPHYAYTLKAREKEIDRIGHDTERTFAWILAQGRQSLETTIQPFFVRLHPRTEIVYRALN